MLLRIDLQARRSRRRRHRHRCVRPISSSTLFPFSNRRLFAGANTFFGRAAALVGADDDSIGHLQKILAQIGSFCLISIGIFLVLEIIVQYAAFRFQYRRGINNLLVLLIGGIPIGRSLFLLSALGSWELICKGVIDSYADVALGHSRRRCSTARQIRRHRDPHHLSRRAR